jgi:hypothetical protein
MYQRKNGRQKMSGKSSEGERNKEQTGKMRSPLFRAFLFVILLETILRLRDTRPGPFKIEHNNFGLPHGSQESSVAQVVAHTEEKLTLSQIKEDVLRTFGIIGHGQEGSLKWALEVMDKVMTDGEPVQIEGVPFLFVGSIGR